MKSTPAFVLFLTIEVLLLPISAMGYAWIVAKVLLSKRRTGVSSTAYSPLGLRWALHESNARRDEATGRILTGLAGGSLFPWRMTMGPTLWAMRLTGVTPRLMRYPATRPSTQLSFMTHRTDFFDSAIRDYLG